MKTKINTYAVMASLILATGCGKPLTEKAITLSNVEINGDSKNYIQVVEGTYTLQPIEEKIVIAIKFETIKKFQGKGTPELGDISLVPTNANGAPIPDLGRDFQPATSSDYSKLNNLLTSEEGKSAIVNFRWRYFSKTEIQKRIMQETVSFEITNADISFEKNQEQTTTQATTKTTSQKKTETASTENWNQFLDKYEELVNKSIALLKKVQNADADAIMEYQKVLESSTQLLEKLEKGQGEMTASQLSRFVALQRKITNAAINMN